MCRLSKIAIKCPVNGCADSRSESCFVLCETIDCLLYNFAIKEGLHPQSIVSFDSYNSYMRNNPSERGVFPKDIRQLIERTMGKGDRLHEGFSEYLKRDSDEGTLLPPARAVPVFCTTHEIVVRFARRAILLETLSKKSFEEVVCIPKREVSGRTLWISDIAQISPPSEPNPLSLIANHPSSAQFSVIGYEDPCYPENVCRRERLVDWLWNPRSDTAWPFNSREPEDEYRKEARTSADFSFLYKASSSSRGLCLAMTREQLLWLSGMSIPY